MTAHRNNILITSISAKIPCLKLVRQAVVKKLPQGSVIGADLDPTALGRGFVDAFWQMPKLSELSLQSLIKFCDENNVLGIIPTRDGELLFFAKHAPELKKAGIHTLISDAETVGHCLDKHAFSQVLQREGLPVIPTALEIPEGSTGPLVVKPRFGAGSAKCFIGVTADEAAKILEKHPGEMVVQPLVSGEEFSIDIYVDATKQFKGGIVRKRNKVINGESAITSAVDMPDLLEICKKASEVLGLYGHAVWQAFVSSSGGVHLIECNCRFGGASSLSVAMGLDSFSWFITEAKGGNLEQYPFIRNKVNLKQTRIPYDIVEPSNSI